MERNARGACGGSHTRKETCGVPGNCVASRSRALAQDGRKEDLVAEKRLGFLAATAFATQRESARAGGAGSVRRGGSTVQQVQPGGWGKAGRIPSRCDEWDPPWRRGNSIGM